MAENLALKILISARDQASGVLKGIAGAVTSVGTVAAGVGATLAGFFGLASIFEGVKAAAALEEEMGGLQATIDATGGAAGVTADQILEMSRRIGDPTEIRAAAKELLTFKSVAGATFERTLTLAKDLASAGFGSIESATVMLAKALENPTQGLSALGEAGVTFTTGQKALITQMMAVGDQAKAQGVILDAVAGQVSGVASGMDVGFNGAMQNVREALQRLGEDLFTGALPALTAVESAIAGLYARASASGTIAKLGKSIGDALSSASASVIAYIQGIDFASLQTRIATFATSTKETLAAWAGTLKGWSETASAAITAVSVAWNAARGGIYTIAAFMLKGVLAVEKGLLALREAAAKYGLVPKSLVDETRANIASITNVMNELKSDALNAYDKMGASIDKLRGHQDDVKDSTKGLADEANRLPDGFDQAAKSLLGLTDAQVAAKAALTDLKQQLADAQTAYAAFTAAGNAQGMAEQLLKIQALKAQIGGVGTAAKSSADQVAGAFATLKIDSQATLGAIAAQAESAFKTISASGTSTPVDIQNAFIAYSTAAIAANGGVADSAIKTQAAMLGLAVQTSDTGDAVIALKATAVDQTAAQKSANDAFWANVEAQKAAAEQAAATAAALRAEAEWFGRMEDVTRSWSEIMQTAGVDLSALGDYADIAEEKFQAVYQALSSAAGALDSMSYEGYAQKLHDIGKEAAAAAEHAAALAREADELDAVLATLADQYDAGALGLSDYLAQLELLRGTYAGLSDEDLQGLSDAIASVKEEMADQADSAVDGLNDWKSKLAEIYDQEVQIQQLAYQEDRLEAELALTEARKNGNAEEIAALEQKIALIDTYYAAKIQAAAEQEAQDAIDAAEAAAAESSRVAGLTPEERAYESAIASLKTQLADAIKAGDAVLKQSILDQIAAEESRHQTVTDNLAAETKAREAAAKTTTKTSADETTATTSATRSVPSATNAAVSYATHITIEGVLDVNDRTTLDTLARKLKPYLTNLERTGA
mgnify:CR=1 FL=1